MGPNDKRKIKSAANVSYIIKVVRDANGARLSEIADELDLSTSTVHHYLTTLKEEELLVREGSEYYLSLQHLKYGEYVRNRKREYVLAREQVKWLAEQTKERAQFIAEEHERAVYVHTESGERAVQTDSGLGKRTYLHATASGKAILAHYSEERIDDVIERHGLPAITENTITEREALLTELDRIRETGVSINSQEDTNGLRAVGAPVRDVDGTVVGALSVSGPTNRIKDDVLEEKIPNLLFESANELELKIAYES